MMIVDMIRNSIRKSNNLKIQIGAPLSTSGTVKEKHDYLMDFDGFLIKFTDFFDFFIIFSELYNHEYWSVDNNFGCSEKLQSQFVHFWQ